VLQTSKQFRFMKFCIHILFLSRFFDSTEKHQYIGQQDVAGRF
jgi:hypothetical protein